MDGWRCDGRARDPERGGGVVRRVAVSEIVARVANVNEDRDVVRRRVLDVVAQLGLCVDEYERVDDPDPLPRAAAPEQQNVHWYGGRRRRRG